MKHKLDVLCVRPGRVTTAMVKNTTSFSHSTAEQTAKEIVNSLGNVDICYGPLIHRLQGAGINSVDPKIVTHVATV